MTSDYRIWVELNDLVSKIIADRESDSESSVYWKRKEKSIKDFIEKVRRVSSAEQIISFIWYIRYIQSGNLDLGYFFPACFNNIIKQEIVKLILSQIKEGLEGSDASPRWASIIIVDDPLNGGLLEDFKQVLDHYWKLYNKEGCPIYRYSCVGSVIDWVKENGGMPIFWIKENSGMPTFLDYVNKELSCNGLAAGFFLTSSYKNYLEDVKKVIESAMEERRQLIHETIYKRIEKNYTSGIALQDNPNGIEHFKPDIKIGSFVKVCDGRERFWLKTTSVIHVPEGAPYLFEGVIANELVSDNGYNIGDKVAFGLRHVYEVENNGFKSNHKPEGYFKPGERVCFVKQEIYKNDGTNLLNVFLGVIEGWRVSNYNESMGEVTCELSKALHVLPLETLSLDVEDSGDIESLINNEDFKKSLMQCNDSRIKGHLSLCPVDILFLPKLNEILSKGLG